MLVGQLGWHRTFGVAWAVAIMWAGSLLIGVGALLRDRNASGIALTLLLILVLAVVPILALCSTLRLGLRERQALAEFLTKLLNGTRVD